MGLKIIQESKYYCKLNCPSSFNWSTLIDSSGWELSINIKMNLKDEIKVRFEVSPPIYLSSKERKPLIFKTSSYRELKRWLKKNKDKLENPREL